MVGRYLCSSRPHLAAAMRPKNCRFVVSLNSLTVAILAFCNQPLYADLLRLPRPTFPVRGDEGYDLHLLCLFCDH